MPETVGAAMTRIALLLLLLSTACSRGEEPPAGNDQQPTQQPPPASAENVQTPAIDPKSPEAAVIVLKRYFDALAGRRYGEAYRLWSDGGSASGMSEAEFAASFAKYGSYRGEAGKAGAMEGAAGSVYVDVPAEVSGHFKTGNPFHETGTATLRRANDVPGATQEQLQWRVYKTDLRPEQPASYRFVGRWATEAGKCATPWRFTATSLKTPAGAVCSFSNVNEVPGGFDIAASCITGDAPKDDSLQLRFAESAKALLVESRVVGDAGLVRCR